MNSNCGPRLLAGLALLNPAIAHAHHSPAAFDTSTVVEIQGTVTEYRWHNPHIYFAVNTAGPDGRPTLRQVEAGPPAQLQLAGVSRDLLRRGDRVTVRAYRSRNNASNTVLGLELIMADGARYPLHSRFLKSSDASVATATTIQGTWVPQPEGLQALRTAMNSWPLSERARKEMAGDRSALLAGHAQCKPGGLPFLAANPVPIFTKIDGDKISISSDYMGSRQTNRIVHVGGRFPATIQPALLGHSVGRWEGATLVIETRGFSAHAEGMGLTYPSGALKSTVERLVLSADRKHIDYEIRIIDPDYLTEPVTYRTRWDYRPDLKPVNAPCDKAVASRFLQD